MIYSSIFGTKVPHINYSVSNIDLCFHVFYSSPVRLITEIIFLCIEMLFSLLERSVSIL
jgi:hypothetical protein